MTSGKRIIYAGWIIGLISGMIGIVISVTMRYGIGIEEILHKGGLVLLAAVLFGIANGIWDARWKSWPVLGRLAWGILSWIIFVACMAAFVYKLQVLDLPLMMLIPVVQILISILTLLLIKNFLHIG